MKYATLKKIFYYRHSCLGVMDNVYNTLYFKLTGLLQSLKNTQKYPQNQPLSNASHSDLLAITICKQTNWENANTNTNECLRL